MAGNMIVDDLTHAIRAEAAVKIDKGDVTSPDNLAPKNLAKRSIRPGRFPPAIEEARRIEKLAGADGRLEGHGTVFGFIGIEYGVSGGAPLGTPVARAD